LTTIAINAIVGSTGVFMQTMNISLPDPMKQYLEEQVSAGAYSSASEYVRELVRADQKRHAKDQLEQILLNAINSGDPIDVTAEMIDEVRKKLRARAGQRKVSKR
jgi:antitoxin ParD1/3/4